jgi:hypothetical protein
VVSAYDKRGEPSRQGGNGARDRVGFKIDDGERHSDGRFCAPD